MPIDPMIANPQTVKLNDPLEQYGNYLKLAQMQGEFEKTRRAEQMRNALVEGYRLNTDDKGVTNFNALRSYYAKNGLGDAIPGLLEDEGKINKVNEEVNLTRTKTEHEKEETKLTGAKTRGADAEAFDKAYVNSIKLLDGISRDPKIGIPQVVNWKMQQFKDPVIGPTLLARGESPEQAKAELKQIMAGGPEAFANYLMTMSIGRKDATKQNITQMDLGGHKQMVATNEYSLGTPKPNVVTDQKVTTDPNAAARAPKVSVAVPVSVINQKGDTSYTETWNKGLAEDDLGLKRAADAAPDLIRRADRVSQAVRSGRVITGAGAPLRLGFEKGLSAINAGDKELIANTETLGSDLAKMTLDHIRTSGLGGGNGFTDKDREFLEKAVAGQITWDNASLQRMAALARQQGEQTSQRWKIRKAEVQSTGIQGSTYPKTTPSAPPQPARAHSSQEGYNKAVALLRAGKISKEAFDRHYGKGAAASVGVQ